MKDVQVLKAEEVCDLDEESEDKKQFHLIRIYKRALLCVIAILLIWVTTLDTAIQIVDFYVPMPDYNSVYDTCAHAYDLVLEQKSAYSSCATKQIDLCYIGLTNDDEKEKNRISGIYEENIKNYAMLNNIANNCSNQYDDMKLAARSWTSYSNQNIIFSRNCTREEIVQIKENLNGITETASVAYTSAMDYSYNYQSKVHDISTYALSLQSYNENYFSNKSALIYNATIATFTNISSTYMNKWFDLRGEVVNKTKELISCLSLDENETDVSCLSNARAYDYYQKQITSYQNAFEKYNIYKTSMESAVTSLESSINKVDALMSDFYLSINGPLGLATNLVMQYGGLKEQYCDTTPKWCDYSENFWSFKYSLPNLLDFDVSSSTGEIWAETEGNTDAILSKISSLFDFSFDDSHKLSNLLKIMAFDDYNPPVYNGNLDQILDSNLNQSDSFRSSLSSLLKSTSYSQDISMKLQNTTEYLTSLKFSSFSTSWIGLTLDNLSLNLLSVTFVNIILYLNIIDIIYRIINSVKTVIKYSRRSLVQIDTIDVRNKTIPSDIFMNVLYFLAARLEAFAFFRLEFFLLTAASIMIGVFLSGLKILLKYLF